MFKSKIYKYQKHVDSDIVREWDHGTLVYTYNFNVPNVQYFGLMPMFVDKAYEIYDLFPRTRES